MLLNHTHHIPWVSPGSQNMKEWYSVHSIARDQSNTETPDYLLDNNKLKSEGPGNAKIIKGLLPEQGSTHLGKPCSLVFKGNLGCS